MPATPDRLSEALRVTSTLVLFQPEGAVAVVLGVVPSILRPLTVALAVLPALSPTEALAERLLPSPVTTLLAGQAPSPAMPERLSLQVQATVTSPVYQPLVFLVGPLGVPLSDGADLSMLIPPTVVLALLSALSTAVPVTDWLAPSPLSVVELVQLLMPDVASAQVKLTVTSLLFQPLPFAAGERLPVMVGAVLSSLTVTEPVPLLPTRSAAVAVFSAVPSAVTLSVAGVGPLAIPEPPALSVALQVMETSVRYHPAVLVGAADERLPVTVGPVLSRTYEASAAGSLPSLTP